MADDDHTEPLVYLADGRVWHSADMTDLLEAVGRAQADLPDVVKSRTAKVPTKKGGQFEYTYADLSDVTKAVIPHFGRHGIAVLQAPVSLNGGALGVVTVIGRGSQVFGSALDLGPMPDDPQRAGALISYGRRYALGAITGIAPGDDDDANQVSDMRRHRGGPNHHQPPAQGQHGPADGYGPRGGHRGPQRPAQGAQGASALPPVTGKKTPLTVEQFAMHCERLQIAPGVVDRWLMWVTGGCPSLQEDGQDFRRGGVIQKLQVPDLVHAIRYSEAEDDPGAGVEHLANCLREVAPENSLLEALDTNAPGEALWKAVKGTVDVIRAARIAAEAAGAPGA